ncbi:MarR family transcriptional regulator [Listeria cossartiae subsp. cayugensis]|uniref:MarR family transcriptional regulator n=1 Tax=Listeria cossartiae subsp. cayugensis TaxID=2713505 RepID=A0A7X0ZC23_9LIST|nr:MULTISPECIES: MarR family transcriptional regulator [Listeria]MBC1805417.1 MarR family transcriptional regulator [Listeria cossartiae subsp. cayugensis]MBC2249686.1 MarR family transcriptional regulator [Listeria cossartiae subsp. cayugensis]MBF2490032.1 MarR family transcriptional regulator [Listeria marthii]MDT0048168.1 MarR family transcriptional regulator [Listeria cossartiae subsp. cayugensis]MDT0064671.1 MarR family transcriptional regulator [Listeria cossartiae subsp. cayugensis]
MDEKLVKEVIFSFREVQRKTHHVLAEEAANREITTTQLLAIRELQRESELTLGELAERMKLGKSTVSGIVDRLVKAGFLKRTRNETNRRALSLELTEKGATKAAETYHVFFNRLEPILEIGEERLKEMLEMHQEIITILEREGARD